MPFKSSARGAYGPQGQKVIKGPLAPVWVTSGALTGGNIGSSYSVQLSATDDSGDAPTYTIASGSLPSGLSLSSSGLISGTIGGSAGTFTFTVNATDVNGRATTSSSLSIATVSPELYSFTTATFTPGGATGRTGPSITQARSGVGNPAWASTYLNMTTSGILDWTVPATATYAVTIAGAKGGTNNNATGGNGISIVTTASLTQGEIVKLIVGHLGVNIASTRSTGGGGGSYMWRASNNTLLCAAGGGGGGAYGGASRNGTAAVQSSTATAGTLGSLAGGSGGAGGTGGSGSSGAGGGGGGWSSNGTGTNGSNGGLSPLNGGTGGAGYYTNPNEDGGFGGGGGGGNYGGGGGGGYSGGGAGPNNDGGGGGGGSYSLTSITSSSANTGNGFITVTKL